MKDSLEPLAVVAEVVGFETAKVATGGVIEDSDGSRIGVCCRERARFYNGHKSPSISWNQTEIMLHVTCEEELSSSEAIIDPSSDLWSSSFSESVYVAVNDARAEFLALIVKRDTNYYECTARIQLFLLQIAAI